MDWRAIALAVLLACAGCTALVEDDQARETVTPAPVPDRATETYAPGVTAEGVVAPAALVAAHERALANRSYTLVIERTRFSDGDPRYRHTVIATVGETAYRVRVSDRSGPFTDNRTTVLIGTANGTVAFERTGGGPFRRSDRADVDVPTGSESLDRALRAVRVETVRPQRAGADTYRLSGTEYRNLTAVLLPRDRLRWVSFEGEIGANGCLRALDWRFAVDRGGTNVTVVSKVDVRRVGRTTVNTTPPLVGNESGTADSQ